jgi:uncharacterized membrane protein
MKIVLILSIILLTPFVVITAFRKYQLAKNIGTVIMAYAVGIFMSFLFAYSNFFSDSEAGVYEKVSSNLMTISVLLAIPLMLFSSDFKLWAKALPKTLIALITGIIAVLTAVIVSFFVFQDSGITTFSKVAAMMAGFYNGGSMNFFAVGKGLEVEGTLITVTLTSEMLIVFPFLIFLTAGGYKLFRWLLPFKDESMVVEKSNAKDPVLTDIEIYDGMLTKKVFPKTMLGLLLSICCLAIGAGLSLLLTGGLNELVVILTITTLAIAASFSNKIRSLPRTFELGMFFILIFSIIVASQFNLVTFKDEALKIFLFVLSITLISIVLHLILCRIFRLPGDLYSVAIVGMLCSPPFIPPIVAAMGNKKVLISGITIGLVGYAIGTYIGVAMYYLLELF